MGSQGVIEENDLSESGGGGGDTRPRMHSAYAYVCDRARTYACNTAGINQFETRIAGFMRVYAPRSSVQRRIRDRTRNTRNTAEKIA